VHGAVLSDHIKSLDWREREISYICKMPEAVLAEVLAKFRSITREILT
jgi:mRNA interferase MazF